MRESAYTDKEWVEEINKAVAYARRFVEADGTWTGSLKELMEEYEKTHSLRLKGSSFAAVLPYTHLVQTVGRKEGSSLWVFKEGEITLDDWIRIQHLRKRERNAKSKRLREARAHSLTRAMAPAVTHSIDDSLTGHPEVVTHSVIDAQQLRDQIKSLREELQTVTKREEVTREFYQETSKALAEKEHRLLEAETLLEKFMLNANAPEVAAFRLGYLFRDRNKEERHA